MKMQKILAVAISLIMVTSLGACSSLNPESSNQKASVFQGTPEKDMVVLDVTTEPMEMNSMLAYDAVAMDILAHCVSGITKLDENDQAVADLAESWDISEDNKTYKIYLRKDAKWSNGEAVTANDYYFSWVTQMKPETGTYMAAFLYENIENGEAFYDKEVDESMLGIKVIDDYTIEIKWEKPKTDGLFLLSLPSYMPVNQKAYEEIGPEEYGKDADKMITNGAYKMTKWVHDDHIMLEKSDEYYNADNIKIPKVKLVMIADTNTRLNAFMTGEIDLCNIYSDQIALVKEKDENAIKSYLDGASWYFGFNMKNEYLANKNLRKALAMSVDVQSLLDNVIADGSIVADGLVPTTIAGVGNENYAIARGSLFAYDLEEAKKSMEIALSELGMTASDLKLTLDVPNTTYNQTQAAYIQQQWKENLGIDITVNAQPWQAIQEAKWNGDFNISVEVNGASENSAMSFLGTFTSDNANNLVKYSNDQYDELIDDANNESDPLEKQKLLIMAEKMLLEDMAVGPLYFTRTSYVVSDKLEGLIRTPFQYFNVYGGATIKVD